jgi:peptidyl-prolyl cis-trans isomerase D
MRVQASGWLSRVATPEEGVLASPKLRAALFSDDALKARRNTDAVEVSPGVLVAARVIEHAPSTQKKYEDVRAEIEKRLRAEEAARLAQRAGEAKLEALRKGGEAGLAWGPPKAVSRRSPQGVPAGALRPLLAAAPSALPAFAGAARGTEGYMLSRVDKVLEPEPRPEAQRSADRARAAQLAGARQMEAYVASLRAQADVEIHAANLEKKP